MCWGKHCSDESHFGPEPPGNPGSGFSGSPELGTLKSRAVVYSIEGLEGVGVRVDLQMLKLPC